MQILFCPCGPLTQPPLTLAHAHIEPRRSRQEHLFPYILPVKFCTLQWKEVNLVVFEPQLARPPYNGFRIPPQVAACILCRLLTLGSLQYSLQQSTSARSQRSIKEAGKVSTPGPRDRYDAALLWGDESRQAGLVLARFTREAIQVHRQFVAEASALSPFCCVAWAEAKPQPRMLNVRQKWVCLGNVFANSSLGLGYGVPRPPTQFPIVYRGKLIKKRITEWKQSGWRVNGGDTVTWMYVILNYEKLRQGLPNKAAADLVSKINSYKINPWILPSKSSLP